MELEHYNDIVLKDIAYWEEFFLLLIGDEQDSEMFMDTINIFKQMATTFSSKKLLYKLLSILVCWEALDIHEQQQAKH